MINLRLVIRKRKHFFVSKSGIACTLLLFPFMKPNGVPNISHTLNIVYTLLMVASFLILTAKVLLRRIRPNNYNCLLFAFMGWLVLRTALTGGQTGSLLEIMMRFCGISIFIQLYARKSMMLIRAFLLNFEIIIYLNFICLMLYPHGMYVSSQNGNWNNWLLGYDNHWFIVYFGACFILFCYAQIFNKLFRPVVLFIVIHVSACIVMSGAIIVGLVIIDLLWLFKIYKSPLLSYRTVWIAAIITNIMLVFLGGSGIIQFVVYSLLHKSSATLLARQRIWRTTISSIKEHLLLGNGRTRTVDRIMFYRNSHASNAHNLFLEILYEGGLTAFGLFAFMAASAGRQIKQHRDCIITGYLLMTLLACLVTGAIDSFLEDRGYMFFALLAFASNIGLFSDY